jgi:hypothetical protein
LTVGSELDPVLVVGVSVLGGAAVGVPPSERAATMMTTAAATMSMIEQPRATRRGERFLGGGVIVFSEGDQ